MKKNKPSAPLVKTKLEKIRGVPKLSAETVDKVNMDAARSILHKRFA